MSPIPVTVIGYGSSARTFHLPFISSLPDLFTLHSIQQRPGSKSGPDASSVYPSLPIHPSIDSVFGLDPTCKVEPLPKGGLVVITIANKLHFSTAKLALEQGRHVLCEKPLALKSSHVKELERIAREQGLVCSAFQNRRFDSDFLTLRSLLQDPISSTSLKATTLGQPLFFESHFDRYRPLSKGGWREEVPPEQGGGILWDLGAHLVDQVVSLFASEKGASEPEEVFALVRNSRGQQPGGGAGPDDSFTLHIIFPPSSSPLDSANPAAGTAPAGLQCTLTASVVAAHIDEAQLRFKVHGTRGSYVKYGLDPQEAQLKKGMSPASHPQEFGFHDEQVKDERVRFGTLTRLVESERDWNEEKSEPTKPPALVEEKVEVKQGRYVDLYTNLAETISAVNALGEGKVQEKAAISDKTQAIKTSQVAMAIRILELARISAQEKRVVKFEM